MILSYNKIQNKVDCYDKNVTVNIKSYRNVTKADINDDGLPTKQTT